MVRKVKSKPKKIIKSKEKAAKATKVISDDKPINDYKKGAKASEKSRHAAGNKR